MRRSILATSVSGVRFFSYRGREGRGGEGGGRGEGREGGRERGRGGREGGREGRGEDGGREVFT